MPVLSSYSTLANTNLAAGDKFPCSDVSGPTTVNLLASKLLQGLFLVADEFFKLASNVCSFGQNGSTNPCFQIDGSTASSATGLRVKSAAAAAGVDLTVLSSGTNENLTINAKGSGTIDLNPTGTGNVTTPRGVLSRSATAGVGYATGAGGAVTQITSRTTGVTLNTVTGAITLVSAAGQAAKQSFTVTNSAVAATDTIVLSQKSGTDKYDTLCVTAVAAGSFVITFANSSGTTVEQPVFNFAVIKGVAS